MKILYTEIRYIPFYPWYIEPHLLVKMRGVQFTMMGFKLLWQKFDPEVKIPYGILNPGFIFQGFKIPYEAGTVIKINKNIYNWYDL